MSNQRVANFIPRTSDLDSTNPIYPVSTQNFRVRYFVRHLGFFMPHRRHPSAGSPSKTRHENSTFATLRPIQPCLAELRQIKLFSDFSRPFWIFMTSSETPSGQEIDFLNVLPRCVQRSKF